MNRIKVEVDFLDFIRTGTFGFLKLGESKTEIINQGFPPEDWVHGETIESSRVWRYGNIELHFIDRDTLSGIYTDYISSIDCGENVIVSNWWIIPNGKEVPSLLQTIKELNTQHLDYTKSTSIIGNIELVLPNGVYFMFCQPDEKIDEDMNKWTLAAIGKR
ncbi:MAG: hypothetical protein U0Y96_02785 [Candidatus Kapaibacterium sp.]|nr:hypothetical protein [Bacteroidota bacterium]